MKKYLTLFVSAAILLVLLTPSHAGQSQSQRPDEAQITAYLNEHPLIAGSGGEVLNVKILGEALVINLSEDVLPEGVYDEALFTELQADLDQTFQINQLFLTTFKVEGELLEYWGRPIPDFSEKADPPAIRELPGDGPLAGVKVALSPGHGLYWSEYWSTWSYQRAEFWDIREDTLNAEIMRYVKAALMNQGATVIQLRELDLSARTGVTGYPAWHEASRQYGIYMGLPSWVWDGSNNNYNSDIRARPYTANYYGADILISLHNNGWDGTLTGTETYWDSDNHPGSQALANAVHNSIIDTIRNDYSYPGWYSRGVKASDSDYGEINYAQMPAALIELAFMDTQYPDNAFLHDETFKLLAANAITEGICDFWGVTCENVNSELPQVLETPTLTPTYGSGMCDSGWYRYPNQRGQYAYLALNATEQAQSVHKALWQPNLPVSGEYQLEVFIPNHNPISWSCPDKVINWDTSWATYTITHANGVSEKSINQAPLANEWVNLGIFHFDDETVASISLSDVTHEAYQTITVSASAARFTLVGNAGTQFYNTAWLDEGWVSEQADAPVDYIRNFMIFYDSCLADLIPDSDGVEIDIPSLIQQAAVANQISPKLLLAVMEAEQGALSQCPDAPALASLMGLEPPSTARDQIAAAAILFGTALDNLTTSGATPNGLVTGVPKTTPDGVTVTPANNALTILFDFQQNAGVVWGGNIAGESGVQGIYAAYRDFHLDVPLPKEIFNLFFPAYVQ